MSPQRRPHEHAAVCCRHHAIQDLKTDAKLVHVCDPRTKFSISRASCGVLILRPDRRESSASPVAATTCRARPGCLPSVSQYSAMSSPPGRTSGGLYIQVWSVSTTCAIDKRHWLASPSCQIHGFQPPGYTLGGQEPASPRARSQARGVLAMADSRPNIPALGELACP